MSSIRLVTVSREFGSGGSDLARALGARLGWQVVDRQVVEAISRRLRISEEDAEALDEHVSSLAERVGALLANSFPELVLVPDPPKTVEEEEVLTIATAIFQEALEAGPAVLVGHGGMCLFQDRQDALHVRVVAPPEHRVSEIERRLGMSEAAAREEMESRDAERRAWIRHHFGEEWSDPTLFGLVVNSAVLGPHAAAAALHVLLRPE